MSSFKYFLFTLGFVVGSEVIFKCLKHIYYLFIDSKNQSCLMNENQRIFSRVIFFPDQGIVSGNLQRLQNNNNHDVTMFMKEKYDPQLQCSTVEKLTPIPSTSHLQNRISFPYDQSPFKEGKECDRCVRKENRSGCDSPECKLKRNCFFSHESIFQKQSTSISHNGSMGSSPNGYLQTYGSSNPELFLPSGYLQKSTSLIHMISVLESAKRSLMICIFVLTCKDLIDAIVRAKQRGVRVRVLLEKGMSNCEATISILHEHHVVFQLSNPALLMHHKFAIVDAPEQSFESSDGMYRDVNRNEGEYCRISRDDDGNDTFVQSRLSKLWRKCRVPPENSTKHSPQDIFDGVLMTGSFNWTWSAVVNNNENVIITNDPYLITNYVREFESLWKNVEAKADLCKY